MELRNFWKFQIKVETRKGIELATYISDQYNVSDKLKLVYGLRLSSYSVLGGGTFMWRQFSFLMHVNSYEWRRCNSSEDWSPKPTIKVTDIIFIFVSNVHFWNSTLRNADHNSIELCRTWTSSVGLLLLQVHMKCVLSASALPCCRVKMNEFCNRRVRSNVNL